jgi:hypothetical protein
MGCGETLQAGVRQTPPCRCGNGLKKGIYGKKGEPRPFSITHLEPETELNRFPHKHRCPFLQVETSITSITLQTVTATELHF